MGFVNNNGIRLGVMGVLLTFGHALPAEELPANKAARERALQKHLKELSLKPEKMADAIGLKLTVTPERPQVGFVEPIHLKLTITNVGKDGINWRDRDTKVPEGFEFVVIDHWGKRVPLTARGSFQARIFGKSTVRGVHPNGGKWETSILLNKRYDMTFEGKYTIIAWRSIEVFPYGPKQKFSQREYRLLAKPVVVEVGGQYALPRFRKTDKPKPQSTGSK